MNKTCPTPDVDYKDLAFLQKYMSPQSQILSRKRTGFCTQCQRKLKRAVKQARHLALVPFVG